MISNYVCGITPVSERTITFVCEQQNRLQSSKLTGPLSIKPLLHTCKHRGSLVSHAAKQSTFRSDSVPHAMCRQPASHTDLGAHSARSDSIQLSTTHRRDGTLISCSSQAAEAALPRLTSALIDGAAAAALMMTWTGPAAAAAEDLVSYDNAAGFDNIQNVFGVGYAMLVAVFAWRLLSRRIKRAKSEKLSKAGSADEAAPQPQRWSKALLPANATPEQEESATPLSALYGAAQAAVIFSLLWTFTSQVSDYFDAKMVPVNPLAAKVTNSVKTIAEGLAYLLTFIFGANAVGLVALAVQLALFPGCVSTPQAKEVDPKALPKINITDDLYSIRKAFEEVQKQSDKPGR